MTQMNVRIDAETKKQGDRALARIGLSPSEAVRALWEFAALVPADQSDFVAGRYFHQVHPDLEDDFILAATSRAEADYLVTNDKRLLSHAPVAALTPTDMLTLLKGAA